MAENYLNKKDMLKYIHESKSTFTYYVDGNYKTTKYKDYDIILCGEDYYEDARNKLTLQLINTRRRELLLPRSSKLKQEDIELLTPEDFNVIDDKILCFSENEPLSQKVINKAKLGKYNRELYYNNQKRVRELPDDVHIELDELVFRVFTYEHIPSNGKEITGKEKTIIDFKEKTNFPPYKHYVYDNGKLKCVAKSHYKRDGTTFSTTHGVIINPLAEAYLLQSKRVSYKHNTKGYSYIDDMVCNANLQLVMVGLQFNELFSDNPFAYFTSVITNSFKTVLKIEKKSQQFRDTLLMEAGYNPSMTEQINQENSRTEYWSEVLSDDYDYSDKDDSSIWDNESSDGSEISEENQELDEFDEFPDGEESETEFEENF